jgi:uncharacterized protein DUF2568
MTGLFAQCYNAEPMRTANLALSFLLELCLLAALGYWGFNAVDRFALQIALGIGAPVLAAVVWGIFLAPASMRRLRPPLHQLLELLLFGLAFTALFLAGQPLMTELFLLVYALNFALRILWEP